MELRLGLGQILAIASGAIIALNWQFPIKYLISGKGGSAAPIVGGLTGALACCLLPPAYGVRIYWWVPVVADPGCLAGFVAAGVTWLVKRLRRSLSQPAA